MSDTAGKTRGAKVADRIMASDPMYASTIFPASAKKIRGQISAAIDAERDDAAKAEREAILKILGQGNEDIPQDGMIVNVKGSTDTYLDILDTLSNAREMIRARGAAQ